MKKLLILLVLIFPSVANAGNDPACAGKDQNACDTMGMMLLTKGKPCAKMLDVMPLGQRNGGDRYRIICQVTSESPKRAAYTLEFGPGNQSYNVR